MAINPIIASQPTTIPSYTPGVWWLKSLIVGGGSAPPGSAVAPVSLQATLVKIDTQGVESTKSGDTHSVNIPDLIAAANSTPAIATAVNSVLAAIEAYLTAQGVTL